MEFSCAAGKIKVTHPRREDALAEVERRFRAGEGFALATINMDHLVKLERDENFQRAYLAQDIVVADGNPIIWLAALAGQKLELVPGSDLVEPLCHLARDLGLPVSMLGASEAALNGASESLKARIPGLKIGALIAPKMGFDPEGEEAHAALFKIAALGPGLCLLALGAPKQEICACLGRNLAPQTGFASVGAGVEFLSGHQKRAPAWIRALALEWAWRAALAPKRLIPRYAACFAILPRQARAAWAQRKARD